MIVDYTAFHMRQSRKLLLLFALVVFCAAALSGAAQAEVADENMANRIASLLGGRFSPESLEVTVSHSRAYAEMRGVILSGIRIDSMRLDALLTKADETLSSDELVSDANSLASLIGYSKGEIVLLEKDVNSYFEHNNTKGFSKLAFDFKPQGFRADGVFSADFLFTLRIRLAAEGVLGLQSGGLYLDDVSIYVEKLKQPAALTNQIVNRVNPLLKWSDIPFKVEFKTVTMDDESAILTGVPQRIDGGFKAVWKPE
ncbi:MAG: DUF2993 domain-containing protein [Synergistaceae bacterium]|jgi:hypothetical protein|nr:DUF2993 domain-containing protein [Synergistaceae bacterium]